MVESGVKPLNVCVFGGLDVSCELLESMVLFFFIRDTMDRIPNVSEQFMKIGSHNTEWIRRAVDWFIYPFDFNEFSWLRRYFL
jgi:hypothetical protein